jgi:aryl-alcohol dehydrogenase (NADP+)
MSDVPTSSRTKWRAVERSKVLGFARFDSVQPRYNLLLHEIERELLPMALEEGIGVIPYNPIAGGMLSGKHLEDADPEERSRFTIGTAAERYQDRYWSTRIFETVEQLRPLASEAGMSLPQMAVAWVLANPVITSPIVGASRPEQPACPLAAPETPLEAYIKARLDELTLEYRRGDSAR